MSFFQYFIRCWVHINGYIYEGLYKYYFLILMLIAENQFNRVTQFQLNFPYAKYKYLI